ncbi:Cobyric acid synthase [Bienertia sinuspersici]
MESYFLDHVWMLDELLLHTAKVSRFVVGGIGIQWVREEKITMFTADGLIQLGGSLVPRRTSSSEMDVANDRDVYVEINVWQCVRTPYRIELGMEIFKVGVTLRIEYDELGRVLPIPLATSEMQCRNDIGQGDLRITKRGFHVGWLGTKQDKVKIPPKYQRFQESDYMDPKQSLCLGALFDIAATNGLDMGRRLCIIGFCRSIEMLSDVVEDSVLEQGGEVVAAEKATDSGLQEKLSMTVAVPLLWGVPPASETLHVAVRSGGGIVQKVFWQWHFL